MAFSVAGRDELNALINNSRTFLTRVLLSRGTHYNTIVLKPTNAILTYGQSKLTKNEVRRKIKLL